MKRGFCLPRASNMWSIWLLVCGLGLTEVNAQQPEDWQPLFNGRDLSGWVLVNTPADTWSFEEDQLRCSGKPIGQIRTEAMFQNFEMEIEWRHMKPAGNAGIFVWADDVTARGVPFHRGIEVQVLENAYGNSNNYTTHGDIFPIHGAEMTPINGRGGKRAFPTAQRSRPSPEWNHYRIVCQDGEISLAVNGKIVTRGKDANPRKGYICLESEGGVVHYRHARIRRLPDTPVNPQQVASADRGFKSIYSGLDLRGWETSPAGKSSWTAKDWILAFDGRLSGADAVLQTADEFQIQGLIIDCRFKEASQSLAIELPGVSKPLLFSAEAESPFALLLAKPGEWNRIEADTRDGIQLKINGQAIHVDQRLTQGKLTLLPSGPLELANIYIR